MTFDDWCYAAVDETTVIGGRPVPMLTTLLYRICDEDKDKFEEALRFLKMAYDAGANSVGK